MPHYYSQEQDGPLEPFSIMVRLKDCELELLSASGVFSAKRLDKGSEVLLDHCRPSGRVLDLGCGYGVVGLVTKKRHPGLEVVLCDVNRRAVRLSRMNAKRLGLAVEVVESDGFAKLGLFDTILFNPPYVAGRKLIFSLIKASYEHLRSGGSLQLVARHQKGGKALEARMKEVFGVVEVLGKGSGFRVYSSKKK